MLNKLIMPDGNSYSIEEIRNGDYPGELPAPLAYLELVAESRPYKGKLSASKLTDGNRLIFLEAVTDFDEKWDSQAFAIHGTISHALVEDYADSKNTLCELAIENEYCKGHFDLIEPQPNGEIFLIDYKTYGSFKTKMVLGVYYVDEPVLDEYGNETYYKSGKKKGEVKTKKTYYSDPAEADLHDLSIQLNAYRLLSENLVQETFGKPIDKLKAMIMVRDGNTMSSKMNNVDKTVYYVDVPFLPDNEILELMKEKHQVINSSYKYFNNLPEFIFESDMIENLAKYVPPKCSDKERWAKDDNADFRCKSFCPVSEICQKLMAIEDTVIKESFEVYEDVEADDELENLF